MRRLLPACMVVGTAALLLSCSDMPTETVGGDGGSAALAGTGDPPPFRGPVIHTARVADDGTLVDGTAVAASKVGDVGDGQYVVEFSTSIVGCVVTAQNALFPQSGASQNNVTTQVLIGYGPGLVQNDTWVSVNHYHTFNPDFNKDSAFVLLVVCPA